MQDELVSRHRLRDLGQAGRRVNLYGGSAGTDPAFCGIDDNQVSDRASRCEQQYAEEEEERQPR
jgi:hypothetical protein